MRPGRVTRVKSHGGYNHLLQNQKRFFQACEAFDHVGFGSLAYFFRLFRSRSRPVGIKPVVQNGAFGHGYFLSISSCRLDVSNKVPKCACRCDCQYKRYMPHSEALAAIADQGLIPNAMQSWGNSFASILPVFFSSKESNTPATYLRSISVVEPAV